MSGNLDAMDNGSDPKPMVVVNLTVEDDWQSDPLRVVAGIRDGKAALDGAAQGGRDRQGAGSDLG